MAHVVEVNRPEDLDHYYLVWTSLLAQTPQASFFHTLDWLQGYWRGPGQSARPRVLIVYSGGEPLGIVPLHVLPETTRLGTVHTLTYPLHDWGSFFGPLGPHPTAVLTAALRHVRQTPRDWDLLDLRWVDRDRHDRGRTRLACEMVGLPARERPWSETSLVDLRGGWEAVFAGRSSKFRNNVRRCEKRCAALGPVELERYRPEGAARGDGDARVDLFDECAELAGRSWQGSSSNGTTLSHESVRGFLRTMHAAAAKGGHLDLCLLRIGGRAAAFAYNYHCRGRVFGLRAGYDPAFADAGAGTALFAAMLRDSCERGDVEFDLGPGYPEAKRSWRTGSAVSYRYTHYPLGLRPQLLRLRHWWRDRGGTAAAGGKAAAVQ